MGSTKGSRTPVRAVVGLLRRTTPIFAIGAASLLTGCASQTQYQTAGNGIDPKYGVRPSPRVVADGEPVPKGGGSALVGKPYTIAGKTYYPSERAYSAVGLASWYGSDFHGRRTANGEVFDRMSISAAHPTMPLPSYARVTNLSNQHSMIVRVNDRGPYHANRVMDVSQQVAEALDFRRVGTARVRVDFVGRASLAGSDDRKLVATLRTDGSPAGMSRDGAAFAVAEERGEPQAPVRVAAIQSSAMQSSPMRSPAMQFSAIQETDEADDVVASVPQKTFAAVPKPPQRPLDLGTIPGVGVPIAAPHPSHIARANPAQNQRAMQALLQDDDAPQPPRR